MAMVLSSKGTQYYWQRGSPKTKRKLIEQRREELLDINLADEPKRLREEWLLLLEERAKFVDKETKSYVHLHSRRGTAASLPRTSPAGALLDKESHYIRVFVEHGQGLLAMDNSGTSDPYVTVTVGQTKQKTNKLNKTLNPHWQHEMLFKYDPETIEQLTLEVNDSDWIGHDYMGGVHINFSNLHFNDPKRMQLSLQDLRPKKSLPFDIGTVTLTLEKYILTEEEERYLHDNPRIVIVDVVDASNLSLADVASTGVPDPYVFVKIGSNSRKTKAVGWSSNPVWKHRLEFHVRDNSQVLTLQILDKNWSPDDVIGETHVDLSALKINHTYMYAENLSKTVAKPSEFRFNVTVCEPTKLETLTIEPPSLLGKFVGTITMKIKRAEGIKSKDFFGRSDSYVMVELGNSVLRTTVSNNSHHPQWNTKFTMGIVDLFTAVTFTVWDEDEGQDPDFLGRVQMFIPNILERNGHAEEWFPLKSRTMNKTLEGRLLLEISVDVDMNAARLHLIKNPVNWLMEEAEPLSIQRFVTHVKRLSALIDDIIVLVDVFKKILHWEYGIFNSLFAMLMYIFMCLYIQLFHVPILCAALLLFHPQVLLTSEALVGLENAEEDEDVDDKESISQSFFQRYKELRTVGKEVQAGINEAASTGERFKSLLAGTAPELSYFLCGLLMIVALVLLLADLYVNYRHFFVFAGAAVFLKGAFRKTKTLKRVVHEKPNVLMQFVNRIPSDVQRAQMALDRPFQDTLAISEAVPKAEY